MSTRTGISFLTGIANSDGGSILKSVRVAGIVPVIRIWFPCVASWNGTCLNWAVWPANCTSKSTLRAIHLTQVAPTGCGASCGSWGGFTIAA